MLTRLSYGSAESSEGYRVERIGRMELRYTEGDRSLIVGVEPVVGEHAHVAIYKNDIRGWNRPHEYDPVTPADKQKIIRNICAVMDFLGIKYILE